MGKVYDALRRAEEQRGRSVDEGAVPKPRADWTSPAPAERSLPKLSWLRRLALRFSPHGVHNEATAANKRRISLLQPDSYAAEQFRTLRARIDSLAAQRPMRSIAVTSSIPGEGKTTTAVNLGIVMSLSYERKVVLVDCDMRKPKIFRALSVQPEVGLAEVLSGQADLDKAIVRPEGVKLDAIVTRALPANPSELLGSARMKQLLDELCRRYDVVILDTPPSLSLPDAKIVSELCDGVVMVVRADETPQEDVQAAIEMFDRRKLIGLVLNGAHVDEQRYRYS